VAAATSTEFTVVCAGATTTGLVSTYGQRPAGTLVALLGSMDHLELALVGGNAARTLSAPVGTPVLVTWPVAGY
jgi:S-adenosylmethionine hydrolase